MPENIALTYQETTDTHCLQHHRLQDLLSFPTALELHLDAKLHLLLCRYALQTIFSGFQEQKNGSSEPRSERISVHAGTFHNFTVPDQLAAAMILPFGANLTNEIGRSSPIWVPRLVNF